ncbi:MAG TPA: ATP-binding protein [Luteolibacter sp.]|nr:ATP-binding protein [Luteolibacter sp.]
MILPSILRRLVPRVALLFWLLASLTAPAGETKRVMILNPYGRDTAPLSTVLASFRSTLAAETVQRVDFHDIPLDLTRFVQSNDEPLVDFLEQRLKSHPADLVVAIASDGVTFANRHRARLFPNTPLLLVGAEPRLVPPDLVGNNATLVTQSVDLPGMIGQVLRMKPETKHLAVVLGATELERKWAGICRREFEPFSDRLEFIWLDALPLGEMLDRASKLPPDSFIFHGIFFEDADGIPCAENEALKRLHTVANAPIISLFASEFGLGSVGGKLYRDGDVGREAARVAARILNSESPDGIDPVILQPGTPVYDWRELRRWNIPVANLPPDHIIRFREPSFWERHRRPAIAFTSLAVLQAGLIVGLLINRRKLHQEQEGKRIAIEQTMEMRDSLSHAGRVSLLGQLASSLAHELSQPLGAILRNAEAAEIMLKQPVPDLEELRAIIDDILRDDHRAGDVIQKLRSLLSKGRLDMQALDIGAVISDVIGLLHSDATGRHVHLTAEIEPGLSEVLGDRIHLQQVLLNLIVNAMDALDKHDKHGRQVRVSARLMNPGGIQVKVCDNGPGIPPEHIDRLFEPFYTTKATGMGMGLLVSQTIVEAHKGKLTAENQPEGGACFCFTLQAAARQM